MASASPRPESPRTAVPMAVSLRIRLQRQTDAAHRRLHQSPAFRALFAGTLTPAGYARLLQRLLALHAPIERALERFDTSPLLGWRTTWPPPRRGALLRSDLASLGVAPTAPALPAPALGTAAAALGCAWVIEGSALGARVIWQRLQTQPALATASGFFTADPDQPQRWAGCCAALESCTPDTPTCDQAQAGAEATFAAFEACLNGDQP